MSRRTSTLGEWAEAGQAGTGLSPPRRKARWRSRKGAGRRLGSSWWHPLPKAWCRSDRSRPPRQAKQAAGQIRDGDWGHVWKVDFSVALAQRPAQTPPCDSAAGGWLGAETLRGEDLDAFKHFEVRPIVRVDARHAVTKHGGGELAVKPAAAGHWMALHPAGDHVLRYRQQVQAGHRKGLADRVEGRVPCPGATAARFL